MLSSAARLSVDADGMFALRASLSAQGFPTQGFSVPGAPARGMVPRARTLDEIEPPATATTRPLRPSTEPDAEAPANGGPRIPTPSRSIEPNDEQQTVMAIVSRAQAGDAEAFGELYDRYSQVVYRYVAYRCGSSTLAEDLTSETFLRALRRISSYTWQGRDFGAWLVTIARNLLADHFKSGRYRLEIATSDLVEAGADRAQDGPEDDVLSSLTNAALINAIKQLGAEQQECIVLRFMQGMSVAETALALGKNEGAIKALQYRAVKALGRLLPPELVS